MICLPLESPCLIIFDGKSAIVIKHNHHVVSLNPLRALLVLWSKRNCFPAAAMQKGPSQNVGKFPMTHPRTSVLLVQEIKNRSTQEKHYALTQTTHTYTYTAYAWYLDECICPCGVEHTLTLHDSAIEGSELPGTTVPEVPGRPYLQGQSRRGRGSCFEHVQSQQLALKQVTEASNHEALLASKKKWA